MDGYSHIFNSAEKAFEQIQNNYSNQLKNFHNEKALFGFIDNGDEAPDEEALSIANSINPSLVNRYLSILQKRKVIGYPDSYQMKYPNCNHLDSRHIMMLTILFSNIPEDIQSVIEIGGGYGNMFYLQNQIGNFNKWKIIDLPHLGLLQDWCCKELEIDTTKYEIISAYNYESQKADLVIGTHSLSEFSLQIFQDYFDKIIQYSKYLFISYHKRLPDIHLIQTKINMIHSKFELLCSFDSEQGNVANSLYRLKL